MLRVRGFSLAVTTLVTATSIYAQLTGRITGTVVDASGASVANARVSLYLPEGKTPLLTTDTNAEGSFTFAAVRPDLYRLVVELAGFTKRELADVKVDPARQLGLAPIKLDLATASQTVEVSGNAQTID